MLEKENMKLFYLLSFTWGIIWTLIGLIILLPLLLLSKNTREISIYRGRILVYFPKLYFGGASLGLVILASSKDEDLLNHEVGHSIQNTFMGPLFIFLVAIPSGIRYQMFDYLSKRYYKKHNKPLDYDRAWFEGQATKLGDKHLVNKKYDQVRYRKKN